MTDWSDSWIWGFPLILLTVLVHVSDLLLIRERIVLRMGAAIDGGHVYKFLPAPWVFGTAGHCAACG